MRSLLSEGKNIFQDDNGPFHAAAIVKSLFEEHENEVQHLP